MNEVTDVWLSSALQKVMDSMSTSDQESLSGLPFAERKSILSEMQASNKRLAAESSASAEVSAEFQALGFTCFRCGGFLGKADIRSSQRCPESSQTIRTSFGRSVITSRDDSYVVDDHSTIETSRLSLQTISLDLSLATCQRSPGATLQAIFLKTTDKRKSILRDMQSWPPRQSIMISNRPISLYTASCDRVWPKLFHVKRQTYLRSEHPANSYWGWAPVFNKNPKHLKRVIAHKYNF